MKLLINTEHLYKYYNGEPLLKDINFTLDDREAVGLVGKNGCGKSTLLNIIIGKEEWDKSPSGEGSLFIRECEIGYLAQNSGLDSDSTVIDEMRGAFAKLAEVKAKMDLIAEKMTRCTGDELEFISDEYSALSAYYEAHDGYSSDYKIKRVLNGMGFSHLAYDRVISSLSGGEKTRLALAKLLLEQPDLLVLDEPTNHLDMKTLIWLEEYLKGYKGALLIVSHDRYFLDKICTRICEIENGVLSSFKGNYTAYAALRAERNTRRIKEYEASQREISKLEEYIEKNKVRASTAKQAKSRRHMLERIENVERPVVYEKPPRIKLDYSIEPTSEVVKLVGCPLVVGQGENEKTLIDELDILIRRGERVALIGDNGIGKTSVLKLIQGIIPRKGGNILWGNNVKISYFDQEHASLDPHDTAIEAVSRRFPQMTDGEIRTALASVLFHGEDVFKPVSVLSGGERAKLCFAIMALNKGNFLILDEPTNHIDLVTREVLEQALAEYEGTMLLVSHDRYLISKTATRIIELSSGKAESFDGGYEYYAAVTAERQRAAQELAEDLKAAERKQQYRSKKQRADDAKRRQHIKELEKRIEELEELIENLQQSLSEPDIACDHEKLARRCQRLEELRAESEAVFDEWAELSEQQ